MEVTLRLPSDWRESCTTICTALAIWPRMTRPSSAGRSCHHLLRRVMASRGVLAWIVASSLRAGVHRLQHVEGFLAATLAEDDAVGTHTQGVLTRSRWRISPLPSTLGAASPCGRHAAAAIAIRPASSNGQERSFSEMKGGQRVEHRRLAEPVPRDDVEMRARTAAASTSAIAGRNALTSTSLERSSFFLENLRIDTKGHRHQWAAPRR